MVRRARGLVPAERTFTFGVLAQICSAVGLRHWLRLQTNKRFIQSPNQVAIAKRRVAGRRIRIDGLDEVCLYDARLDSSVFRGDLDFQ
jgi:hypothetical protein